MKKNQAPAVSVLHIAAVLGLSHVEHRQAAVHVTSQASEEGRRALVKTEPSPGTHGLLRREIHILLVAVTLVHTGAVFEGVDKAGDVVGGDGDNEGIGDDRQHANAFQNPMPDTWQPTQRMGRGRTC